MRDLVDELLQAKVKTKLFGGEHAPRLGRLVLIDRIGSGAMGTVFAAYDAKLERKVAIKVVTRATTTTLLAEARALAKLAHPNVVAVHDVGEEDGLVYIVMELVHGVPLRAWLGDRARPWRDVMRMLRDAAKGIAAAHEAGLVHRDIKPDNILVDDQRARVVDFGLAQVGGDGTSAGTPNYMAPEALADDAVTAASDQFSFGVTLFEALYGVRPHAAHEATVTTRAPTRRAGAREGMAAAAALAAKATPPSGTAVPAWVHAVIVRTLAADPAQRFPHMSDVVSALSRDRRRARFAAIVVATAVIGAGLGALTMHSRHGGDPCTDGAKRRATVWNESRRAGVRSGLANAPWTARTIAALDDASSAWETSYRKVCEATRVHGGQSDALLELRMRCLDRVLDRFNALAAALAGPPQRHASPDAPLPPPDTLDASARAAAPSAVAELPAADECEALADAAELALPADKDARDQAIGVEHDLDRGWVAFGLGRYRDARDIAAHANEVLPKLDAPALHANALVLAAAVAARIGEPGDAKQKLAAALEATAASRTSALELDVWARLLRTELFAGTPAHVIEWAPFARAAASRAGRQGAEVDGIVAEALRDAGRLDEARGFLVRALATTDPLRADQRAVLELNLGSIELATGHSPAAAATFGRARDRVITAYGDRHPDLALYYDKLAAAATARGKIRDALALHGKSIELRTAAFGADDRAVATSLYHRAQTELEAGQLALADQHIGEARAIRVRLFGAASPRIGELEAVFGDVAVARGDLAAARAHYATAKQLDARLGLVARGWFAGSEVATGTIPTYDPKSPEPLTAERVTALWVRANVLLAHFVPEDIVQVAAAISASYRDDLDPALAVAIARVEAGGGRRQQAADHFAAALAHAGNEPTRTALDAAIGLAQLHDPRAAQAARTAVSLYQAMPELGRAMYPAMAKQAGLSRGAAEK